MPTFGRVLVLVICPKANPHICLKDIDLCICHYRKRTVLNAKYERKNDDLLRVTVITLILPELLKIHTSAAANRICSLSFIVIYNVCCYFKGLWNDFDALMP